MIQSQMINLVNRVVPCPSRITDATTDKGGARGAKLLNGFRKTPVAGRPPASLPVRAQCTSTARTWQARLFLPREGSPAGDWFANLVEFSERRRARVTPWANERWSVSWKEPPRSVRLKIEYVLLHSAQS